MRNYGVTNLAPYAAAPPVGPAGDTYYNSNDGRQYISNGTSWLPLIGVPAGGGQDQVLRKNTSADYDVGWTGDPGNLGGISSVTASGNNTFGTFSGQRINGSAAMGAVQNALNFRGMGWDGVSAYRVLGGVTVGSDAAPVSPTNAGGTITFQTVAAGTLTNTARLRIGSGGMVEVPGQVKIGQLTATAGLTGSILDLSNGLLNIRRQAVTLANGANNDITLPTSSFVEFVGPTAAFSLTGIAGGIDGAIINFLYLGTQSFAINHQITSAAANQTYTLSGVQESCVGPCAGTLVYNANISKWVLVDWQTGPPSGTIVQEFSKYLIGAWGTTNSAAYVVISTLGTIPVTKKYAGTVLEYTHGTSGFVTGAAGLVQMGVSPSNAAGTVVLCSNFFFNAMSAHSSWTGLNQSTGLGAGSYTCSLWVRVGAGMTITNDANDVCWFKVKEVWP